MKAKTTQAIDFNSNIKTMWADSKDSTLQVRQHEIKKPLDES